MNTVDIKGRELHFLRMVINHENWEPYTMKALLIPPYRAQWSKEFINEVKDKGWIRLEDDKIYATDLAKNSIKEKDKAESKLIEEYILDDFEYAFLMFMDNRNEPVPLLDFPSNFKYHSKIDGKMVDGDPNLVYDWMTEIEMYVTDPTIDGYILNHTGKIRYEKLKRERKIKEENELLDIQVKRQTIEIAKFSRNVAYISLFVAGLTAFVPLFIWHMDRNKIQNTQTQMPQLQQVMQNQEKSHKMIPDALKILQSSDTFVKKITVVK